MAKIGKFEVLFIDYQISKTGKTITVTDRAYNKETYRIKNPNTCDAYFVTHSWADFDTHYFLKDFVKI